MTGTRFGIETIREVVRRRVAETSLRQVADEIPMSFSGLRSFLRGGTPQPATRAKLVSWCVQARTKRRSVLSETDVQTAIELLRAYLYQHPSKAIQARRRAEILGRLE
jgi:hypothetical protein